MFNLSKKSFPFLNNIDSHIDVSPQIQEFLNSVIKMDQQGNLISFNPAFAAQFNYKLKDFQKPFFDIFLQTHDPKFHSLFEEVALGKTKHFHAVGLKKNGEAVDVNLTLVPIEEEKQLYIYVIIQNISEFKEQEKKWKISQKFQDSFNELDHICYFYYDAINDKYHFSKQFPELFGINPDNSHTPSHKKMLQYIYAEDRKKVDEVVKEALKNKTGYTLEYRILKKDNTFLYVFEKADIAIDENGALEGLVGFIQDMTHSQKMKKMIEKEKQLSLIEEHPEVSIWTKNTQFPYNAKNSKGIENITGYTVEELQNNIEWFSIIYPQDRKDYRKAYEALHSGKIMRHQYRIIHKNGTLKWVQDYAVPVLDHHGKLVKINGMTFNISTQKELEEEIKFLSEYDPLTKLPNRQLFYEMIVHLTNKDKNSKRKSAIMLLNIDRFKYVNDTLGYEVGDELLAQIAARLSKQLTAQDILARQDGAQFSILIGKLNTSNEVKNIAEKIIHSLEEPFIINQFQLYVTVSIGIAIFPGDETDSLELFRNAEHALAVAKKRGKMKYCIVSDSSNIQSYKCFSIGRDIKKALKDRELVIYYQPRVDAKTNQIISAEALIRWNHPEWGQIAPNEFLGIAEENGLIIDIDDWVIEEVCKQIKTWKDAGLPVVPVSVNVSAGHLSRPDWPITVAKVIAENGIEPQDFELEITENSLLTNEKMIQNSIELFRKLGIKIALDDFGKGYSSLMYLTQYHFDILKIDRSFIKNMLESERDLFITKSIIYLAKGLNIRVVAEGVETLEQLEVLKKEDCFEIQGYLFSRPVPLNDFEELLRKEMLQPIDPADKLSWKKRQYYRLQLPHPLAATMQLVSVAGQNMQIGKSTVLIEDISIDGLRCLSTLKLPVRGDVVFRFDAEILNKTHKLLGWIVWKEEQHNDLVEYGIQFKNESAEQDKLKNTLQICLDLMKKNSTPPYNLVTEDKQQYLLRVNSYT